jgi:hypothetical protein
MLVVHWYRLLDHPDHTADILEFSKQTAGKELKVPFHHVHALGTGKTFFVISYNAEIIGRHNLGYEKSVQATRVWLTSIPTGVYVISQRFNKGLWLQSWVFTTLCLICLFQACIYQHEMRKWKAAAVVAAVATAFTALQVGLVFLLEV